MNSYFGKIASTIYGINIINEAGKLTPNVRKTPNKKGNRAYENDRFYFYKYWQFNIFANRWTNKKFHERQYEQEKK